MLILSRKPGECVFIGPDIIVRMLPPNEWGEPCLGIIAPPGTDVCRDDAKRHEPRHTTRRPKRDFS